jgi:hypothetical protein
VNAKKGERSYFVWTCTDVEWNIDIWSHDWTYKRISRRRWLRRALMAPPGTRIAKRFRLGYASSDGPAWTRTRDQPIMSRLL